MNPCFCDPNGADGNCDILTPLPDGTECDDGDACTENDACDDSGCVGGMPVDCSDDDVCNGEESCDPDDGECQPGDPLNCDDEDACTEDGCDPELGCVHAPIECPPGQTCVNGECVGQCQQRTLIVKQGACPAPVNSDSNGVVPILLVGDFDFAAETAVRDSLKLRLCDDPDGPYMTPLASFTRTKDINHPNAEDVKCGGCTCNENQSSDGIDDLSMKFRAREFFTVFGLTSDSGQVTLELSGVLEDGTPFCARDCILLVP